MDILVIMKAARDAGLVLAAQGDTLVVRGPRGDGGHMGEQLQARKAEVLAMLCLESLTRPIVYLDLPKDWLEFGEERAAIMEYEGGLERDNANKEGLEDTLNVMRRFGLRDAVAVARDRVKVKEKQ